MNSRFKTRPRFFASNTSVKAVGVVTGDYVYKKTPAPGTKDYNHCRTVNWLVRDVNIPFKDLNGGKNFTLKTFYELWRLSPATVLKRLEEHDIKIVQKETKKTAEEPVVLIIDEINRGNISKVFGELITLLEPSKRAGQDEALSVCLPYSQERLCVPDNLYIIGTMNTADRSLAMMDTALRRRFDFIEMMPDYRLLSGVQICGVKIDDMLEAMNQRIEYLYDREHMLGHAFFMPLIDIEDDNERLNRLGSIFKNKVIPLFEEYFYEDWEKIRLVLADNQTKEEAHQFIIKNNKTSAESLFGNAYRANALEDENTTYCRNPDALQDIEAYKKIIAASGGQ
ncbi:hypothetical protein ACH42_00735 [Endozoicomonas sp. (ex Bugula neritina AB1)]|nr:hypothetical protein ACH42_00735 [Endozoicomonas sp. (ex Bugula neritina AB1)]